MGFIKDRIQTNDVKNANYNLNSPELLSLLGLDTSTINSDKLGETVFFTCINFLVNSIGKLPIYKYNQDAKGKEQIDDQSINYILNLEPNEYVSASNFWNSVELSRVFYGNSYVYISRDFKGNIDSLWMLDTETTTVWRDYKGIFGNANALWYVWYDKNNSGKKYTFSANEILHYKTSTSWDGLSGVAVKDILRSQIDTQKYSQSYINNLYKNNMFGDKILLYTEDIGKAKTDALIKDTERYNNLNSTKFLPIPSGINVKTLSMKLTDSDFSVINNSNALLICSAFQLSPNVINNYDKSSFANSTSQKLDFYTDALSPILNMYKQENTRKMLSRKDKMNGIILEHDYTSIFKLDPIANMKYAIDGTSNLLMTLNQGRKQVGLGWVEGGDVYVGNGALTTLDNIISGDNYNKTKTIDPNASAKGGEITNGK